MTSPLAQLPPHDMEAEEAMKVRRATLGDLAYIDALRKREGRAIGFIPMQRYEMEIRGERKGSLLVVEDDGQPTGFIYATHSGRGATHIQQVAIQEDARRMERATALVNGALADGLQRATWLLSCRVADDLEANDFWAALGFTHTGYADSKSVYATGKTKLAKSQRLLRVWQKTVGGLWLREAL